MRYPLNHEYGSKSAHWKGGRSRMFIGYVRRRINGKDILEHRYVMEQNLQRKLKSNEMVHHKNHDKTDNRLENLELMTRSAHMKIHASERWKENPNLFDKLKRCGAERTGRYKKLGLCKKLFPCCRHLPNI